MAGWVADLRNSRFQPARAAGLDRDPIKHLKLKRTCGFRGAAAPFGQPTSLQGKRFVGSEDGRVYALDSAAGCMGWSCKASATVKTAVRVGNQGNAAFFGDTNGFILIYALADGSFLWKAHPDAHSAARTPGSPPRVGQRL